MTTNVKKNEILGQAEVCEMLDILNDNSRRIHIKSMTDFLLRALEPNAIKKHAVQLFKRAYAEKKDADLIVYLAKLGSVDVYHNRGPVNIAASNAYETICYYMTLPNVKRVFETDMLEILRGPHPEEIFNRAWLYENPYDFTEHSNYFAKESFHMYPLQSHWFFSEEIFKNLTPKDILAFRAGATKFWEGRLAKKTAPDGKVKTEDVENLLDQVADFWAIEDCIFMTARKRAKDNFSYNGQKLWDEVRTATIGAEKNNFFSARRNFVTQTTILKSFDAVGRFFTCPAFEKIETLAEEIDKNFARTQANAHCQAPAPEKQ